MIRDCVYFGAGEQDGWQARRLLDLVPDCHCMYIRGSVSPALTKDLQAVSVADVAALDPDRLLVIAAHPFWTITLSALRPKSCVAIMRPRPDHLNAPMWDLAMTALLNQADFVCSESERDFLEQSFRRPSVLMLHSEDDRTYDVLPTSADTLLLRDYELMFREAVQRLLELDRDCSSVTQRQWAMRADYYQALADTVGPHETVDYLLASYLYLLHRPEAKIHLLRAFEQMVMASRSDSLSVGYRFVSAMEAQSGSVDDAVLAYETTAVTASEREQVQTLHRLLEHDQSDLARALVLELNEDYASALSLLKDNASVTAKQLQLRILMQLGKWEQALPLLEGEKMNSLQDELNRSLIAGSWFTVTGQWHQALHSFLEAAAVDHDLLQPVLQLQAFSRVYEAWRGGIDDEGLHAAQDDGKSPDSDDDGEKRSGSASGTCAP